MQTGWRTDGQTDCRGGTKESVWPVGCFTVHVFSARIRICASAHVTDPRRIMNVFLPVPSTFTGRDSSVGIATRYGQGFESRWGARFSTPVQTGPEAYPACCTVGTGSLPGVKRPERGADHPPPSKWRGHERVGLYLYSPSGNQWPVIGRTFTFILMYTSTAWINLVKVEAEINENMETEKRFLRNAG